MNRKAVVLLVFLAVFCILPVNLSAYDDGSAIAAEPNSTKDFVTAAGTNYEDFVDQISDLHAEDADIGTHSDFAEEQDYDGSYDTLTEANTGTSTSQSRLPTTNTNGAYPWTNPTNVYVEDTSYATAVATIVTYRSVGTMAHGTTAAVTPGLPGSMAANDIVVLYATTIAGGTVTITATGSITTWTAISGSPIDVTGGEKLYAWWGRFSSGSTGPSVQAGGDHILGRCLAFYNCYTGGVPIDVSATGTETTSDTTMSFATGLTTTYNNELVVCIFSTGYDPASDSTAAFSAEANTNLGSVTERSDNDVNEGGGGGAGSCSGTLIANGAVGTFTATYAYASPKAYIAFALRSTVPNNAFDQRYDGYGITGSGTITAVEVGYEAFASVSGEKLDIYTSETAGSSWHTVHTTAGMGTTDPGSYTYIDVTSDTAWTWSLLSDTYFEVKVVSKWVSATPTWSLDALVVRVTYTPPNYELDLEVGWIAAQYSESNEYLCIYGGTQGAEALRVDVWSGSWINVISDLVASQWNNVSVSPYLTGSTFEIRFTDTSGESTLADAWQVDGVLLHCWTILPETVNISQVLVLSETPSTVQSLSLVITEVLEASATPSLAMALLISFVQIIAVAAAVSTQTAAVIMTFQAITIASVSSTAASMGITLNELLSLTSSTAANILMGQQYSIIINELLGMSSAISTAFDAFVGISEAIGLFDIVEAIINPPIILILYALLPIGLSGIPEGGLEGVNIFYDLFFSANMWSYLGPMGLVVIGYFLVTKNKILGILWFIVECLFMAQYFTLVTANPAYWWHIFILLFGGLFTCVYPLWDR